MDVEKESFYAAPPFDYQPSIAEYLSTLKVTKNGVIADIMRLDKMGKIKLLDYPDGGLRLKLKNNDGLNQMDMMLWTFLEKKADKDRVVEIGLNELSNYAKFTVGHVIWECGKVLGFEYAPLFHGFSPSKHWWGYLALGFAVSMVMGFAIQFFMFPISAVFALLAHAMNSPVPNMLASLIALLVPFAIAFVIGKNKLAKSKLETKYLFGHIMSDMVRLYALMACLVIAVYLLPLIILPMVFTESTSGSMHITPADPQFGAYVWPVCISMFLIIAIWFVVYNTVLGKTAYFFLLWLFEPEGVSAQRRKWLEFKDFVIENSEIEKRPLKYYELWGEFYYYALSVGAMEKK